MRNGARVSTFPTDRSISPLTSSSTWPTAMIAVAATYWVIVTMLSWLRNTSEDARKYSTRPIATSRMLASRCRRNWFAVRRARPGRTAAAVSSTAVSGVGDGAGPAHYLLLGAGALEPALGGQVRPDAVLGDEQQAGVGLRRCDQT